SGLDEFADAFAAPALEFLSAWAAESCVTGFWLAGGVVVCEAPTPETMLIFGLSFLFLTSAVLGPQQRINSLTAIFAVGMVDRRLPVSHRIDGFMRSGPPTRRRCVACRAQQTRRDNEKRERR